MNSIILYTDGSCLQNPGPGGWAFAAIKQDVVIIQRAGFLSHTTNNQMELQAVIEALEWILKNYGPGSQAQLMTDSRYVQQGITTWIHGWLRKNWRNAQGEPVKNQPYWTKLHDLDKQLKIQWCWVKAHHTDTWNQHVDHLARQAALEQRELL